MSQRAQENSGTPPGFMIAFASNFQRCGRLHSCSRMRLPVTLSLVLVAAAVAPGRGALDPGYAAGGLPARLAAPPQGGCRAPRTPSTRASRSRRRRRAHTDGLDPVSPAGLSASYGDTREQVKNGTPSNSKGLYYGASTEPARVPVGRIRGPGEDRRAWGQDRREELRRGLPHARNPHPGAVHGAHHQEDRAAKRALPPEDRRRVAGRPEGAV